MTHPRQFVIEADGGSRGNPGPAGYGAVVIDPVTGETLAEAAEYIGVATNNVAEYKGLIAGLKAAKALVPDASAEGALQVRVRMDSKLVVEQMSGRWKIKHPDMKPLAAAAARILPASAVTYEWIPREKNKETLIHGLSATLLPLFCRIERVYRPSIRPNDACPKSQGGQKRLVTQIPS